MTSVGYQSESLSTSWILLLLGVGAASMSAIFTRYADGAGALAVSFYRCAGGAVLLIPFALSRVRRMNREERRSSAWSGAFLALHFATWISSLYLTSVSSAVLLVSTTPIFVAAAARLIWNDRLAAPGWIGIGVSLLGSAMVAGAASGDSSLAGNLLALAGGAAGAGYALSGQVARRSAGILEYSVVAYGVAAILLLGGAIVSGTSLSGYDSGTWWAIIAVTLVPQLLGHTLINITLRDLHATLVTVTIMAEPIIATALAYLLFEEVPSPWMVPGGIAILLGIYLVSRAMTLAPSEA